MAEFAKDELKTAIAEYVKGSGLDIALTDEELTESTDNLLAFFEVLIEADKKLMKADESSNNRDPNNTD